MAKSNLTPLWVTLGIIGIIVIIGLIWIAGSYNGLVRSDETANEKWANVQSAYQRRADLIPNLVETVQGAANFEQSTQTRIAELRSGAVAAQQATRSAQTPEELEAASQQVENAVAGFRSLNINVENYPTLRANENFLSLQDELAGTENRVKTERDIYNAAIRDYNVRVRRFPTNVIAGMFGFEQRQMFQAQEGTEQAPRVNFSK
jgi:LemA protein